MAKGTQKHLDRATRLKHYKANGEPRRGKRKTSLDIGRFQGGKGVVGYNR